MGTCSLSKRNQIDGKLLPIVGCCRAFSSSVRQFAFPAFSGKCECRVFSGKTFLYLHLVSTLRAKANSSIRWNLDKTRVFRIPDKECINNPLKSIWWNCSSDNVEKLREFMHGNFPSVIRKQSSGYLKTFYCRIDNKKKGYLLYFCNVSG